MTIAGDETNMDIMEVTMQNSFIVSADMAHALHPTYTDRHEPQHGPTFHKGIVIKHNANQRYATNSVTATLFRGCGSTIGPQISAKTGIKTVDVGMPQWSMHSVR